MDTESVSKLDIKLKERVKGQEYALSAVRRTLINSFLGMNGIMLSDNMTKPKGILFFAGPTGVGKTELAKAIAEFVFGDENRLIRFDMSEFNHEHSDQRLIGAPPGYVGYDAGGELTNKIKENPFSVLLFDEIEKAHGKIMDKFLQILEDGRLTSAKGELIDFSETFIIFTSNIGANDVSVNEIPELNRNKFIEAVCKHFTDKLQRPELLNRIGIKNIIPFDFIKGKEIVDSIISIKLDKLFKALKAKHNINLISKGSKTNLLDLIGMKNDFKTGGRGIVATIETVFVDNLNIFLMNNYDKIIIRKRNEKILNISFSVQSEKIIFSIE